MNKITLEHYPVANLPDDLRRAISGASKVKITIEAEEAVEMREPAGTDWFSRHEHLRRSTFHSLEEVDSYVRALRDEWSHRER